MRVATLATALASLSVASARLVGIAAPSTIAPKSAFTLTLITENYIQAVADVAVAWGFSPAPGHPYSLGSLTGSSYLGPSKSNQLKNVTIHTTAPAGLESFQGQEVVLGAAIFSLYGVSGGPSVANFNVTVTVGNETSTDLVRSNGFVWGTA